MDKKTLSKNNEEKKDFIAYTSIGGDIISQKTLNGNYQILVDMVNEVKNVREIAKDEREKQIQDIVEIDNVLTSGNIFL